MSYIAVSLLGRSWRSPLRGIADAAGRASAVSIGPPLRRRAAVGADVQPGGKKGGSGRAIVRLRPEEREERDSHPVLLTAVRVPAGRHDDHVSQLVTELAPEPQEVAHVLVVDEC